MPKPTLYICSATQATIVNAAPVKTFASEFLPIKALVLRGLRDGTRPTVREETEALVPGRCITDFLQGVGTDVRILDAPSDDFEAWRHLVAANIGGDFLLGIDVVLMNCQGGTKQMSFGAWDALQNAIAALETSLRPSLRRCFVSEGVVSLDNSQRLPVKPLSLKEHLQLYGYEEVDNRERVSRENWVRQNGDTISKFVCARFAGRQAEQMSHLAKLYMSGGIMRGVWPRQVFQDGGWLEAYVYLKALSFRTHLGKDDGPMHERAVHIGVKIRNAYARARTDRVELHTNDYELDLVIMGPGVLHIIECKSGKLENAHLHTLEVLRRRLQGLQGLSVLVTTEVDLASRPSFVQKARSASIVLAKAEYSATNFDFIFEKLFS